MEKGVVAFLFLTMFLLGNSVNVRGAVVLHRSFEPSSPKVYETAYNYTYVTSFGNYTFDKQTGAFQYTFVNGTVLAPSVRFILQFNASGSWEDFNLTTPVFTIVSDDELRFLQNVMNHSINLRYIIVSAVFSNESAPKLSLTYDVPAQANFTFRVVFKVTVPQAWEYLIDKTGQYTQIPKNKPLSLTTDKVRIIKNPEASLLRLLVDWSDYGETEVLLKGSTITVIFPEGKKQVDPTVIGESSQRDPIGYQFQRKLWYMAGRYWVFYSDGSKIVYKHSKTGNSGNWSDPITVRTGVDNGFYFSITFNGTYLHYALAGGQDNPLRYRMGTPLSNGTIVWADSEQNILNPTSFGILHRPSITTDSNGYPIIGYTNQTASQDTYPFVVKSDQNNGTWNTASGYPYQLSTTSDVYWQTLVVPLTSGDFYVFYVRDGKPIRGKLNNGSWQSEESTTNSIFESGDFCAVNINSDIHLVWVNKTTYEIVYAKRDSSTGWQTEISLGPGRFRSPPTITADGSDLYVFWEVLGVYYFKGFVNNQWDDTITWFTTTYGARLRSLNSFYRSTDNIKAIAWSTETTPYSVMFKQFSYVKVVSSFTIYNTNKDYPILSESWDAPNWLLSFITKGNVTIDVGDYGMPKRVVVNNDIWTDWNYDEANKQVNIYNIASQVKVYWRIDEGGGGGGGVLPPLPPEPPSVPTVAPDITVYGSLILLGTVVTAVVVSQMRREKTVKQLFRNRVKRRSGLRDRWRRRYG